MNTDDFRIVILNFKDIKEIVKLENECFNKDITTELQYKLLLKRNTVTIYGLELKDELISMAVVIYKNKKQASRIYSFCVKPSFREKNIGTAMLTTIEYAILKKGYTSLYLEVSEKNILAYDFYIKRGYTIIGKYDNFYEDGSSAIRMGKLLNVHTIMPTNPYDLPKG